MATASAEDQIPRLDKSNQLNREIEQDEAREKSNDGEGFSQANSLPQLESDGLTWKVKVPSNGKKYTSKELSPLTLWFTTDAIVNAVKNSSYDGPSTKAIAGWIKKNDEHLKRKAHLKQDEAERLNAALVTGDGQSFPLCTLESDFKLPRLDNQWYVKRPEEGRRAYEEKELAPLMLRFTTKAIEDAVKQSGYEGPSASTLDRYMKKMKICRTKQLLPADANVLNNALREGGPYFSVDIDKDCPQSKLPTLAGEWMVKAPSNGQTYSCQELAPLVLWFSTEDIENAINNSSYDGPSTKAIAGWISKNNNHLKRKAHLKQDEAEMLNAALTDDGQSFPLNVTLVFPKLEGKWSVKPPGDGRRDYKEEELAPLALWFTLEVIVNAITESSYGGPSKNVLSSWISKNEADTKLKADLTKAEADRLNAALIGDGPLFPLSATTDAARSLPKLEGKWTVKAPAEGRRNYEIQELLPLASWFTSGAIANAVQESWYGGPSKKVLSSCMKNMKLKAHLTQDEAEKLNATMTGEGGPSFPLDNTFALPKLAGGKWTVNPPGDGRRHYEKHELAPLALRFRQIDVLKSVEESGYGPSRMTVSKWIPVGDLNQEHELGQFDADRLNAVIAKGPRFTPHNSSLNVATSLSPQQESAQPTIISPSSPRPDASFEGAPASFCFSDGSVDESKDELFDENGKDSSLRRPKGPTSCDIQRSNNPSASFYVSDCSDNDESIISHNSEGFIGELFNTSPVGEIVGLAVGETVGASVGDSVGAGVGETVRDKVELVVGKTIGEETSKEPTLYEGPGQADSGKDECASEERALLSTEDYERIKRHFVEELEKDKERRDKVIGLRSTKEALERDAQSLLQPNNDGSDDVEIGTETIHSIKEKLNSVKEDIRLLEKEQEAAAPDIHFQTIAWLVLARTQVGNDGDVSEIKAKPGERTLTAKYLKLPQLKECKPTASKKSQKDWIERKRSSVEKFISLVAEQVTEHGKRLVSQVVEKLAKNRGYVILARGREPLIPSMAAIIALRDTIGCGTNAFYRLTSALKALRPDLYLFPNCIKAKMGAFESEDAPDMTTVYHDLIAKKSDTQHKSCPFAFLQRPHLVVEKLVQKCKADGIYQQSSDWMSKKSSSVFSIDIDKGGTDIVISIRCANKKHGNSMKDTMPIAIVGGCAECHSNEKETIFNKKYPIRQFLHHMTNHSYQILTIRAEGGNNISPVECRSIVFLPTPVHRNIMEERHITVDFVNGSAVSESDVTFSDGLESLPRQEDGNHSVYTAPEVSIPLQQERISVRLIKSKDSQKLAVGAQLIIDGKPIHSHRFQTPLMLKDETTMAGVSADLERVRGFPVNDGKQQNILCGISNNACICACSKCKCTRENFGQLSERLYKLKSRRGLIDDKDDSSPPTDPPLRIGEDAPEKSYELYKSEYGKIQLTAKKQRELLIKCASVTNEVLWDYDVRLNSGGGLHLSAGIINRNMDECRVSIRDFEKNSDFMKGMYAALDEVTGLLDELATSSQQMSDKSADNRCIELHKESLKIRRAMNAKLQQIDKLDLEAEEEEGEEPDKENDDKWNEKLDKALKLQEEADEIWKQCIEHADSSNYSHYVELRTGLIQFHEALVRFLSDNSNKRPRGKLEYIFNHAIEYVGGGKFMAEHSGYEQTNGKALNTLQNFDKIAAVCVGAFEGDTEQQRVIEMFEGFKKVAAALFPLATYMKSQEKTVPEEMDAYVLNFIIEWDKVFPHVPYFNKLHDIVMHVPEFVNLWGCLGRLSEESHESVHALLQRHKNCLKRMPSDHAMFKTLFARSIVGLKDGVANHAHVIKDKMTGSKRNPYNTQKPSENDANVVSTQYTDVEEVDGELYVELPCDAGRLHSKYIPQFLYVAQGRAPEDWTRCFKGVLSLSKLEKASFATH